MGSMSLSDSFNDCDININNDNKNCLICGTQVKKVYTIETSVRKDLYGEDGAVYFYEDNLQCNYDTTAELCQRFWAVSSRYFNGDSSEDDGHHGDESDDLYDSVCCKGCAQVLKEFCDDYDKWILLPSKLNEGSNKIAELMKMFNDAGHSHGHKDRGEVFRDKFFKQADHLSKIKFLDVTQPQQPVHDETEAGGSYAAGPYVPHPEDNHDLIQKNQDHDDDDHEDDDHDDQTIEKISVYVYDRGSFETPETEKLDEDTDMDSMDEDEDSLCDDPEVFKNLVYDNGTETEDNHHNFNEGNDIIDLDNDEEDEEDDDGVEPVPIIMDICGGDQSEAEFQPDSIPDSHPHQIVNEVGDDNEDDDIEILEPEPEPVSSRTRQRKPPAKKPKLAEESKPKKDMPFKCQEPSCPNKRGFSDKIRLNNHIKMHHDNRFPQLRAYNKCRYCKGTSSNEVIISSLSSPYKMRHMCLKHIRMKHGISKLEDLVQEIEVTEEFERSQKAEVIFRGQGQDQARVIRKIVVKRGNGEREQMYLINVGNFA